MQLSALGRILPSSLRRMVLPAWNNMLRWEHAHHERRFLQPLVRSGDLVFDIGCNVGDKTDVLLDLGAAVVAVDPSAVCVERVKHRFKNAVAMGRLHTECVAVGSKPGEINVTMIDPVSGMYSGSADFLKYVSEIGYAGTGTRTVACLTLDQLVARYGKPALIKIDVEGMDAEVLEGLRERPRYLSFEYHTSPTVWSRTEQCFAEATRLGFERANLTDATAPNFVLPSWVPLPAALDQLRQWASTSSGRWGDVFLA